MDDATYDPVSGLITLTSSGFHSQDQVRERSITVGRLVERAKREKGFARILNFALDLPVQSSEVAATSTREAAIRNPLNGPRDKFALVISSPLARMQMERVIGCANRHAFANEDEARAWLAAD